MSLENEISTPDGKRPDRATVLLMMVLLVGLVMSLKLWPPISSPTLLAEITQQDGEIETIDTPRRSKIRDTLLLDSVAFPERSELIHRRLGRIGFDQNLFIDFSGIMEVTRAVVLGIDIKSDDGFRLSIDDRTVCEFPMPREYSSTTCSVELIPGRHVWRLNYFQGSGGVGIRALYETQDGGTRYFGQESENVRFILPAY